MYSDEYGEGNPQMTLCIVTAAAVTVTSLLYPCTGLVL